MSPEERAQKIAEITRAQKIADIRASQGSEPGVDAIGNTEGPTVAAEDESLSNKLKRYGATGLQAAGKVLDVPRAFAAPWMAQGIQALTGKQVANWDEWKDAMNPTNLKTFPGNSEMMKRGGIPEGAKLSDYVDYAPKGSPWYKPEAGGLLDPTLRGSGGFGLDVASDPLTYLSLGSSAVAKKALKEGATRAAIKEAELEGASGLGKALQKGGDVLDRGVEAATQPAANIAENVAKVPGIGPWAVKAATAPSQGVDWLGKKLYNAAILPVEHEGAKFGKADVGQTLFDMGIANPLTITDRAAQGSDALIKARDKILSQAGEAGAKVPMAEAIQPAQAAVEKLRQIKDPEARQIADQLEQKLKGYTEIEQGKPAGAPTVEKVPSGQYTDYMEPIMKEKVTPGTPAIPGSPYTPEEATKLKTFLYNSLPGNQWNELSRSSQTNAVRQKLATGLKEGVENSVAKTQGVDEAARLAELNAEAGKLLSTKRSLSAVERQADRLAHGSVSPTGTGKVMAILKGPQGLAMDMAGNAARLSTMPTGYALRKLAEGRLSGPALDAYIRRKYIENVNQGEQP